MYGTVFFLTAVLLVAWSLLHGYMAYLFLKDGDRESTVVCIITILVPIILILLYVFWNGDNT